MIIFTIIVIQSLIHCLQLISDLKKAVPQKWRREKV